MKELTTLAIIPARGGSKSIPKKNIVDLHGIPLIAHSINTAKQTSLIDKTIVSTDSEEIKDISLQFGAEVPFLRPEDIAQDHTPDLPVFIHCLKWLAQNQDYVPDLVIHLRPTTPFRDISVIEDCINLMKKNLNADSLRVVTMSKEHPYKMWTFQPCSLYLKPLLDSDIDEPYNQPRQALPTTFFQPGYIDVIRTNTILQKNSMSGDNILGHVLKDSTIVDIDDQLSLDFSRFLSHE